MHLILQTLVQSLVQLLMQLLLQSLVQYKHYCTQGFQILVQILVQVLVQNLVQTLVQTLIYKMRFKDEYSVVVDWTTTSYNIDMNELLTFLKRELRGYDIRKTKGSEAIVKLRDMLNIELKRKYNWRVRNVQYVIREATLRMKSLPGKQYHIDLNPYE